MFTVNPIDIYQIFPSTLALVHQILPSEENLKLIKAITCSLYLANIKDIVFGKDFFSPVQPMITNGIAVS